MKSIFFDMQEMFGEMRGPKWIKATYRGVFSSKFPTFHHFLIPCWLVFLDLWGWLAAIRLAIWLENVVLTDQLWCVEGANSCAGYKKKKNRQTCAIDRHLQVSHTLRQFCLKWQNGTVFFSEFYIQPNLFTLILPLSCLMQYFLHTCKVPICEDEGIAR